VHAIERIGEGPWYDRLGRLVSSNKTDLVMVRPASAEASIKNDLPNEDGIPNHNPDGTGEVDNHDILTGSDEKGQLYKADVKVTCNDWTKSAADPTDAPRVGHSWPRSGTSLAGGFPAGGFAGFPGLGTSSDGGRPRGFPGFMDGGFPGGMFPGGAGFSPDNWMSALDEAGCGAGASLIEMGGPREQQPTVGSGGGYGGIYCFALTP
jgi:hypothetical protein